MDWGLGCVWLAGQQPAAVPAHGALGAAGRSPQAQTADNQQAGTQTTGSKRVCGRQPRSFACGNRSGYQDWAGNTLKGVLVRTHTFIAQPPHPRHHSLGHKSFVVNGPLALLGSAFYAVLVHRLAIYPKTGS
jgi:hypothetical protein